MKMFINIRTALIVTDPCLMFIAYLFAYQDTCIHSSGFSAGLHGRYLKRRLYLATNFDVAASVCLSLQSWRHAILLLI